MTIHRVLVEKLGATDAADFVGNAGELFFDPATTSLKFSDGSTAGGAGASAGSSISDGTNSLNCDGVKIAMTGSLIPTVNNAYDIGSAEYKIRDLYVNDGSIHTESGNALSFYDGNLTWGGDEVIMLQDLKDMMAAATSFEDFKTTILGL